MEYMVLAAVKPGLGTCWMRLMGKDQGPAGAKPCTWLRSSLQGMPMKPLKPVKRSDVKDIFMG
ncbi:MAG TPA: hypothetical protein VGJ94_05270 [Syntrophorhabdaceae bacterium]